MEKKNNGSFAGFRSVFMFTAGQNIKEKGFKLSTIVMALIMFVTFFMICVIMANVQKSDSGEEDIYQVEDLQTELEDDGVMENLVIFNQAGIPETLFDSFSTLLKEQKIEIAISYTDKNPDTDKKEFKKYCLDNYENPVGLGIFVEDDKLGFEYYLFEETEVSESMVSTFAVTMENYYTQMKYYSAGLPEDLVSMLVMPTWENIIEAGEEEDQLGTILVKMIVPMLFGLVLFSMVCLYGQSITKVVMAEKTSKLMEVLLTCVKPHTLLAGKIIAMVSVAIVQIIIFVSGGIAGYLVGNEVAKKIYPDYENIFSIVIDIIKEDGTGFTMTMLLVAVVFTLIGFLLYCVWAGFIASVVDKVDDLSTAVSLFQIPAMIGFFVSYLGPILEIKGLMSFAQFFPVLSPFVMPADLLVGNATMIEALISLVILVVFTIIMIYAAGKVYKGKLFNRK